MEDLFECAYDGFSSILLRRYHTGCKECSKKNMGIVLNYCQYGVLYLGSYCNTGPYISFPHFENSNLGKLPHGV